MLCMSYLISRAHPFSFNSYFFCSFLNSSALFLLFLNLLFYLCALGTFFLPLLAFPSKWLGEKCSKRRKIVWQHLKVFLRLFAIISLFILFPEEAIVFISFSCKYLICNDIFSLKKV